MTEMLLVSAKERERKERKPKYRSSKKCKKKGSTLKYASFEKGLNIGTAARREMIDLYP